MERSKRTTILLPSHLHARLERLAKHRGVSLGHLIRRGCEVQYGLVDEETRAAAVAEIAALSLPVGDPRQLKQESTVDPDALANGALTKRGQSPT